MFNFPATELFNAKGARRVVWSPEEYASALAEGWAEEKPPAEEKPEPKGKPKPDAKPPAEEKPDGK